jgi:hypothetical protein
MQGAHSAAYDTKGVSEACHYNNAAKKILRRSSRHTGWDRVVLPPVVFGGWIEKMWRFGLFKESRWRGKMLCWRDQGEWQNLSE